ncbi:hypothetical protein XENTR_v10005964 [Xenopus tropicalis]|nr:hypothetical protein XENTR_v10005964 [Xenopus tropicalis]
MYCTSYFSKKGIVAEDLEGHLLCKGITMQRVQNFFTVGEGMTRSIQDLWMLRKIGYQTALTDISSKLCCTLV